MLSAAATEMVGKYVTVSTGGHQYVGTISSVDVERDEVVLGKDIYVALSAIVAIEVKKKTGRAAGF